MQLNSVSKSFDHQAHLERELKRIGLKAGKESKKYPEDKGWNNGCFNRKIHIKGRGDYE